ncbi:MAG TPA: hypothetical protein VGD13_14730, partial [Xanthobacteraceae bacterium]
SEVSAAPACGSAERELQDISNAGAVASLGGFDLSRGRTQRVGNHGFKAAFCLIQAVRPGA